MCYFSTKTHAVVLAVACFFAAGTAVGEPVPDPVMTITNIPELPPDSFYYGVKFRSDGLLYIWEGSYVWRQDGVNVDSFTQIGEVVANMADAGPICFSRDETQMLLGNGAGGWGPHIGQPQHAGRIFNMPIEGSVVSQPIGDIDYHYDFATLPQQSTIPGADQKFFVNYGWEYYMTDAKSWVSVFDAVTGTNQIVLGAIPGASGAITTDNDGNLYACVGYGENRGLIKWFDVEDVDEAFNTGVPLAWSQGTSLNPDNYDNQSAAGLFFDSRGFLFSGGNEGLTVFRPDGTSGTYDVGSGVYSSVAYNPLNDQILVMTTDDFTYEPIFDVYEADDFLPTIPGDANCDGKVNQEDAAMLATNWLKLTGADWFDGDFNGDNAVNDIDATLLAANWLCGVSSTPQTIPEPSMLCLLATFVSLLVSFRKTC